MISTRVRLKQLFLILALLFTFTIGAVADPAKTVTITMANGTRRIVRLEGVGCTESICSRVLMKGRAFDGSIVSIPFETISAIQDVTYTSALFVMKDGKQQRLSLLTDFRVLYSPTANGRIEKIDLAKIKSLEIGETK